MLYWKCVNTVLTLPISPSHFVHIQRTRNKFASCPRIGVWGKVGTGRAAQERAHTKASNTRVKSDCNQNPLSSSHKSPVRATWYLMVHEQNSHKQYSSIRACVCWFVTFSIGLVFIYLQVSWRTKEMNREVLTVLTGEQLLPPLRCWTGMRTFLLQVQGTVIQYLDSQRHLSIRVSLTTWFSFFFC